jgi:hypothetical protein
MLARVEEVTRSFKVVHRTREHCASLEAKRVCLPQLITLMYDDNPSFTCIPLVNCDVTFGVPVLSPSVVTRLNFADCWQPMRLTVRR